VVWLDSGHGTSKNVGRIITSGRLKVTFETVATLRPNRLFITAEDNENVQYPDSIVVLTTDRIRY